MVRRQRQDRLLQIDVAVARRGEISAKKRSVVSAVGSSARPPLHFARREPRIGEPMATRRGVESNGPVAPPLSKLNASERQQDCGLDELPLRLRCHAAAVAAPERPESTDGRRQTLTASTA